MYSAEELDIPGIIAKNPLTTLINWEGKRGVEAHELNFGAASAATTAAADDDCATAAETYGEDVDADGAEEEEATAEHEAGLVAVHDEEEAAAEHEAGLVAVDVEDKAVTEEVGKLPSFILDDPSFMGTPVYVARLVKLIGQSKEVKKTVARTGAGGGRVANLPASGVVQVLPSTPTGDPMADDNITVGDYALALIQVLEKPTAAVVEVATLRGPNGANAFESGLAASELSDPRTAANVRPLMATVKAGVLYFTGSLSCDKELKVAGSVMMPLTPRTEIDDPEVGIIKLAADIEAITECAKSLWLQFQSTNGNVHDLLTAPSRVSHLDESNVRLFVTEIGGVEHSRVSEKLKCPIDGCSKDLSLAATALQHSAHHFLHTRQKLPFIEMCPLCFGLSTECPPFLVKGKSGGLQPRIPCLKYAPAANCALQAT